MAGIRNLGRVAVIGGILALTFSIWSHVSAQSRSAVSSALQGVWRAQEMVWVGGANPRTVKTPQPYYRIYAGKHFSLVGIQSGEPRRVLPPPKNPATLTDAEKIARYEEWLPFHAQAGTYEVRGNTVVHHWIVGKAEPAKPRVQTHEFKLDGDTLWLFNREGGNGAELNVRYIRLESLATPSRTN